MSAEAYGERGPAGTDDRVHIVEVAPRDGLQNESTSVPVAVKAELIERLAATGLQTVELTSFVSPRAIPQLADAAEVMASVTLPQGVAGPVLVPNMQGFDAAREAGATSIAVFTAASETFNQRNINASIDESIERFRPIVTAAHVLDMPVRAYVSMAFGCPYEGEISSRAVGDVVGRLADLEITDISLGDTIGVATPPQVTDVVARAIEHVGINSVGLHLHDTRGTALACVFEGLRCGVRTFDTAVAGLGGCPFADGATGNLATEDLVYALERSGWTTGVDLAQVVDTARWISAHLGRAPRSHLAVAPPWPPS